MTKSSLEFIAVETGNHPKHAIIWLHGLGADGHDFEGVVPELNIDEQTPVRFIFPHAPVIPVTINNGIEMRAWYDIKDIDFQREVDSDHIRQSCEMVTSLADGQISQGIQPENMILAGFSQGGVIALHAGLKLPYKIAGILALSCYIADKSQIVSAPECINGKTPIFIGHGTLDDVVPFRLGQQMAAILTMSEYYVRLKTYPMSHGVCPDEIRDISAFIGETLSKPN